MISSSKPSSAAAISPYNRDLYNDPNKTHCAGHRDQRLAKQREQREAWASKEAEEDDKAELAIGAVSATFPVPSMKRDIPMFHRRSAPPTPSTISLHSFMRPGVLHICHRRHPQCRHP